MPAACAEAIEVFANTPHRSTTCLGFDRIDGCAGPGAEEVVYKWVVPASGNYTIQSAEVGTGVIRSTGRVNAMCNATSSCPGLTQTPFTAGQVLYFAIESQTGCMQYDFSITSN